MFTYPEILKDRRNHMIPSLVIMFLVGVFCFLFTWWLFGPVEEIYEPINKIKYEARVDNDTLFAHQFFNVKRDLEVNFHSELRRKDENGNIEITALPSTKMYLREGEYDVIIPSALPKHLKPGNYTYSSRVTWEANPLKEGSAFLPALVVTIPELPKNN